jgi:WD40 repeat protein
MSQKKQEIAPVEN